MIDHPDLGRDPLAGRNPHPREQIDLWPLHDARQELLEEIVSQPRAGEAAGHTKVLLSVVGIAAALALVAGGAWAITRDGSGGSGRDDQVVAATSDDLSVAETTQPTDASAQPPKDRRRDEQSEVRRRRLEIGSVVELDLCLRLLSGVRADQLEALRLGKDGSRRKGGKHVIRLEKDARYVVVDDRCRVLKVRPRERGSR